MLIDLQDAQDLADKAKALLRDVKALERAKEKNAALDPFKAGRKQMERSRATLDERTIHVRKAMSEAHCAAVNAGVADPRQDSAYKPTAHRYSALHHQAHYQPPIPRIVQERLAKGGHDA